MVAQRTCGTRQNTPQEGPSEDFVRLPFFPEGRSHTRDDALGQRPVDGLRREAAVQLSAGSNGVPECIPLFNEDPPVPPNLPQIHMRAQYSIPVARSCYARILPRENSGSSRLEGPACEHREAGFMTWSRDIQGQQERGPQLWKEYGSLTVKYLDLCTGFWVTHLERRRGYRRCDSQRDCPQLALTTKREHSFRGN